MHEIVSVPKTVLENSHRANESEEAILQGDWLDLADGPFPFFAQSQTEN
jgi:hypothetical protein